MQTGDKLHIKAEQYPHAASEDEHEVVEDTGKGLVVRNLATGEESTARYYQVADWHRCAQCGRPRKESELKSVSISFRNSRQEYSSWKKKTISKQFLDHRSEKFCIDGPCASHYQMGCEG